MAVIHASKVHAVASSKAAQAMATCPRDVALRRWSVRIRASTGKAVMLIETATNSENANIGADGASVCSGRAKARPAPKGTRMLSRAERPATRRNVFSSDRSRRRPTRNMKSTRPIWLRPCKAGRLAAGKRRPYQDGAIQPRNEGPSNSPAMISPITGGCPSRRVMP
jgi:hypothetical protein